MKYSRVITYDLFNTTVNGSDCVSDGRNTNEKVFVGGWKCLGVI